MTTPEWPPLDPGPVQEWTPATVADDHSQRIRKRQLVRRLPQSVYDTADSLSFVPTLFWLRLVRLLVWTAALMCYMHDRRFEALLVLVVGLTVQGMILAQLMIMERGE
jgi:hypothetical protein